MAAEKKDSKDGAARELLDPSYFDPTLEKLGTFSVLDNWVPGQPAQSVQTVQNSYSFFNVSYT